MATGAGMAGDTAAPAPRPRGRPRNGDGETRANLREVLLRCAIAQFAQGGFEAVGLRQIAADAGVNAAMIVHYFGSKLGLWQAAIDALSDKMLTGLSGSFPGTADGNCAAARLRNAVGHLIDVLSDTPALAAFILREVAQESERSAYAHERLVAPAYAALGPVIAAYAAQQNAEDRVEVDLLFIALTGAVVSAINARPLLDRISGRTRDEAQFRAELKTALIGQLAVRLRAA